MKRTLIPLLAATAAFVAVAVSGASAASPTVCSTTITHNIAGNVTVPAGASCTLDGILVSGSVTADQAGASLVVTSTHVGTTVTVSNGASGSIDGSQVGGSVTFSNGASGSVTNTSVGNRLVCSASGPVVDSGNTVARGDSCL
jgi:hypothetical protein